MKNSGMLSHLSGVPIYESALAVERKQHRFPKTKTKRLLKKWRKDPANFRENPAMFMINNPFSLAFNGGKYIVMHPSFKAKLEDAVKRQNEAYDRKWN